MNLLIYLVPSIIILAAVLILYRHLLYGVSHGIPSVYHIAGMTFAETRRRRILQVVILLAALMLVGMLSVAKLRPGEPEKALISGGMNLMMLLGTLVAIFICAFMIPTDIDKRTIYSVLSKPVKRWEFVLGKYFGALAVIGLLMAVMLLVQMAVLIFTQHYSEPGELMLAVLMAYFGIAVFTAAVMAVSTVASSLTTVVAGFVIWMTGGLQSMAHSVIADTAGIGKSIMLILSAILPHLEKFDFSVQVSERSAIGATLPLQAILYGVGYVAVCLIVASLLFNERQV